MTCCQIGARLPWLRCDQCTCRGCSPDPRLIADLLADQRQIPRGACMGALGP